MNQNKIFLGKIFFTVVIIMILSVAGYADDNKVRPEPVGKPAESVTDASIKSSTNKLEIWKLTIGSKEYSIERNGIVKVEELSFAPILSNGKTMMPARTISELLGIELRYDDITKTAKFVYLEGILTDHPKENVIEVNGSNSFMYVNGAKQNMSTKPIVVEGRVYLSVSDIREALSKLGMKVDIKWDNNTKEIILIK